MEFNYINRHDEDFNKPTYSRNQIKSILFLKRVKVIIADNYKDENFGLPALCASLHLSRTQVYRKLISLTDIGPAQHIKQFRLFKAKELLQSTDLTITEIAYKVGFRDASYFTKVYKEYYGCLPSEE